MTWYNCAGLCRGYHSPTPPQQKDSHSAETTIDTAVSDHGDGELAGSSVQSKVWDCSLARQSDSLGLGPILTFGLAFKSLDRCLKPNRVLIVGYVVLGKILAIGLCRESPANS